MVYPYGAIIQGDHLDLGKNKQGTEQCAVHATTNAQRKKRARQMTYASLCPSLLWENAQKLVTGLLLEKGNRLGAGKGETLHFHFLSFFTIFFYYVSIL